MRRRLRSNAGSYIWSECLASASSFFTFRQRRRRILSFRKVGLRFQVSGFRFQDSAETVIVA
jgi:hypothetical protein